MSRNVLTLSDLHALYWVDMWGCIGTAYYMDFKTFEEFDDFEWCRNHGWQYLRMWGWATKKWAKVPGLTEGDCWWQSFLWLWSEFGDYCNRVPLPGEADHVGG